MERAAAAFGAVDRGGIALDEGRAEEREALDVIPVRVPDEDVRFDGLLALGHQFRGQPVGAGAAIEYEEATGGGSQLDARGVASEVVGARSRSGDRPPGAPATNSDESRPFTSATIRSGALRRI